jgi:RNA polymerase sigma factor (sigma-70 family)
LDAEEVVQNSLMVVARKYRGINFETSFAAWAHKVLSNEILKYYRAKSYRQDMFMSSIEGNDTAASWDPNPEIKRRLLDCMKKLCETNSRYARTLNLKYQGYGAEDICRKLKMTANHFYVALSRARSMLKHCLEKGEIE